MAVDEELVARVRTTLSARGVEWDEQRLFGSLVFLVSGEIALAVRTGGGLLVRCHPDETEALLRNAGSWYAQPAPMGGRPMGRGWIDVSPDAVARDEGLSGWVSAALRR